MALPVIAVPNGIAVRQATTAMGGLPVTVSTNGFGLGVTPVATGGLAVTDTTGTLFGPAVIPANLTPPVISGTTTVGQTLTTTVGTWSGTLATYAYQWKRGGVNIAGATSNTYLLVTADGTTNITATVTATNPAGSASATSAAVGPITPLVLPANTVLPVISGTATVGQTLTTTSGTWTGTAPITYTYQWKRAGTNISGATANTYALVTADAGAAITVTVTATNAAGNTSATSAATGAVLGVPVNSVLPAISGTTNVGQTLTTTNGTWSGSPTYSYQWLRNGSAISGATASTYLLVAGDATTNVSVTVTATNGAGSANATSTAVGPITAGAPAYQGPGDILPGAICFYGLRAYSAAQRAGTTKAMKISDNSFNFATDIFILPSGLLDYAALNTWIAAHGTAVVQLWYDQLATGSDMTYGVNGQLPRITISPPGLTTGRAALFFDGAIPSRTQGTFPAFAQPFTASVVSRQTAQTAGGVPNGIFCGTSLIPRFGYTGNTATFYLHAGGGTLQFGTANMNTWYATQCVYNGASSHINIASVASPSGADTANQNVGSGDFGGQLFFGLSAVPEPYTGYITELCIWPSAVTAAIGANQIASL